MPSSYIVCVNHAFSYNFLAIHLYRHNRMAEWNFFYEWKLQINICHCMLSQWWSDLDISAELANGAFSVCINTASCSCCLISSRDECRTCYLSHPMRILLLLYDFDNAMWRWYKWWGEDFFSQLCIARRHIPDRKSRTSQARVSLKLFGRSVTETIPSGRGKKRKWLIHFH